MRSKFKTLDNVVSIRSWTNKSSKFSGEKQQHGKRTTWSKSTVNLNRCLLSCHSGHGFSFLFRNRGTNQGIQSSTKLVPSHTVYKTSTKHHITNRWINQHLSAAWHLWRYAAMKRRHSRCSGQTNQLYPFHHNEWGSRSASEKLLK